MTISSRSASKLEFSERMLREARDDEAGDERGDAEALARGLLQLPARGEQFGGVDVHPHGRLGDLAARAREVRGGGAADAVERHAAIAVAGRGRRRRMPRRRRLADGRWRMSRPALAPTSSSPHERLDVAAHHEVVGSRPVELARVEPVLAGDAAHDRRDDGGAARRIEPRRCLRRGRAARSSRRRRRAARPNRAGRRRAALRGGAGPRAVADQHGARLLGGGVRRHGDAGLGGTGAGAASVECAAGAGAPASAPAPTVASVMSTLPAWSTWPISPPSDSTTPANGVGQLHDRLGRLELDDGLVDRDLVAGRHEPRDDLGLGEALAEVGQDEVAAHRVPLPGVERGEHAVGGRQVVLLELRRRVRDVEAGDAQHRRGEVVEVALGDAGGDLGAVAAELRRLVDHGGARGLAHGCPDRLVVEGGEAAQVDDLDREPLDLGGVGRLERGAHGGAVGDAA